MVQKLELFLALYAAHVVPSVQIHRKYFIDLLICMYKIYKPHLSWMHIYKTNVLLAQQHPGMGQKIKKKKNGLKD